MIRKSLPLILVGVLVLGLASVVLAAPQAFDLSWWTVDGGGGTSEGETYALEGTIGQADAGYEMTGGAYTLAGGFWGAGGVAPTPVPLDQQLYLPLISRQ